MRPAGRRAAPVGAPQNVVVTLVLSQPAAEIPFAVTAAVWVIGERILSFRDLRSGAWKSKQDAGSYFALTAAIVGGFAAGLVLALHQTLSLPDPAFWVIVGLTGAWAGMLLRLWAVRTLGRLFTTTVVVRHEQAVVTSGPYRFVRHPAYLGVLILSGGFGLALGDLASATVMVVLPALGLMWRIRMEETALGKGLGDSYIEYCRGRARLVPWIW
jgi:protein-S-isoprenylcysteine O-methyltransferase Ste14